jgi:eukaryotic-like serine/threonine-protein kinase
VIAAVLEHEPAPLAASSDQAAPPAVDAFIRTCLAKNPEGRWSSGHDLCIALRRFVQTAEAPSTVAPSKSRSRRAVVPWVIAALFLATTIAALYRPSGRAPRVPAALAVKSFIDFPNAWLVMPFLSTDGRYMSLYSFSGVDQEGRLILVRRLADGETTWVAGTEYAQPLTWSPDSRFLAVIANGEIKVVNVATGGIRTVGRAPDGVSWLFGGAWSGNDILLGGPRLRRLSIADGHVTDLYRADPEVPRQSLPSFLPDGRSFLYSQESGNPARRGVFLGTLDSSAVTRLLPEPAWAKVSSRGYLLYGGQGTLFAQRFDLEHHRLTGDPVSIGSGIEFFGPYTGVAVNGDTLVWSNGSVLPPGSLTWFDRNGRRVDEIGEVRRCRQIALAPDGQRAVSEEIDPRLGSALFVIELTRPIHARLTTGDDAESDPIWSPDSREVAFNSVDGVYKRRIDQIGRTTLFAGLATGLEDWTHDGRFVILGLGMQNVSALPLGGDKKPVSLIESSSLADEPHVSRDGRWLAYSANDTGQWEVYLQPFMRPGGRVRVSTRGGSQPRWRADGKELFYLTLDGVMMSVDTRDPANPGAPRTLFEPRFWVNPVEDQYDVTADGQRFLLIVPEGQQATRLTVLTNWSSVLSGR